MTTISLSHNELNALIKNASKGAGYHWGEAQDIAHIGLWLAKHYPTGLNTLITQLNTAEQHSTLRHALGLQDNPPKSLTLSTHDHNTLNALSRLSYAPSHLGSQDAGSAQSDND